MSLRRRRSGGSSMRATARRKKRSSRKRPAWTSRSRSRLVAAMTRTSTRVQLATADAAHLGALDRAQELRLERDVEIANLVDEERPAVGLLEEPRQRRDGPGEGAALVPEERRLQQVRGDGRAVEDDERSGRARPRLVQRLGEDLLAGPGLALDDDGDVGRGDAIDERIEAPDLVARSHERRRSASDRTRARSRRRPPRRAGRSRRAGWSRRRRARRRARGSR